MEDAREMQPIDRQSLTVESTCSNSAQIHDLWRKFGAELPPENAPQSDDPGWQPFYTIATGQQGMYRLNGDNNSSAQGSYADVFKREACFGGRIRMLVAVKRLRLLNIKDQLRPAASEISEQCRKRLSKETKIWMTLRHPNIAPLLGYEDDKAFCMISPWFENGNIHEYMRRTSPTTLERLHLIIQVASGVAYLHELTPAIVHGDIKPDNIVVDGFGVPWIIDFGLSRVVQDAAGAVFQSLSSRTGGGNSRWVAPELLKDAKGTLLSSDVYSFACTALYMMSGELPFVKSYATEFAVCCARCQGAQPMIPGAEYPTIDSIPGLQLLLQRCWAEPPAERPVMQQVVTALARLESHVRKLE
ncbi:hypothetical protein FS837_012811 [Tulasnella sp. UAMH 9824]|nr:hypothetical protein FS837_012811 [Tulasnella sp. UAMH 9824]